MNRHYEALLVLNTQAKEENVKEMIERLESEFEKEGARSSRSRRWISGTSHMQPARSMPVITSTSF
jgi:hypothetical protein